MKKVRLPAYLQPTSGPFSRGKYLDVVKFDMPAYYYGICTDLQPKKTRGMFQPEADFVPRNSDAPLSEDAINVLQKTRQRLHIPGGVWEVSGELEHFKVSAGFAHHALSHVFVLILFRSTHPGCSDPEHCHCPRTCVLCELSSATEGRV